MFSNIKTTSEFIDIDTLISPVLHLGFTEYNKYLNTVTIQPDRDFNKLIEIIHLMK